MDDESTAQSIWVLALQVRVIPVRPSLINLKVSEIVDIKIQDIH
jgi:hypothetical protein